MINFTSQTKGFTLIELLVVMAIIGILASITIVQIDTGIKQARDSRRLQGLFSFITAMEMYYQENEVYPGEGDGAGVHLSPDCPSDTKNDLVNGGFMTPMIVDQLDNGNCSDHSDDAFFYGWDAAHCCEGSYCVSINRLESQWAVDLLTERFGQMNYVTGGGDANIGAGDDFNYCFVAN